MLIHSIKDNLKIQGNIGPNSNSISKSEYQEYLGRAQRFFSDLFPLDKEQKGVFKKKV